MDSTRLCRLCLETGDDLVNVSDSFQDSTISSILTQHFWFKIIKNDGSSEYVCKVCWIHTKAFHEFYTRVESLHKKDSVNLVRAEKANSCVDLIKQEYPLELDLKNEEAQSSGQIVFEIIKVESRCDQSSSAQTSDDECRPDSKKQKPGVSGYTNPTGRQKQTASIDCESDGSEEEHLDASNQRSKTTYSMTQSEKDVEAAQVRELFNMNCEICDDIVFETLAEARKHYRRIHQNRKGYITCCGRKFRRHFKIVDHLANHYNPDALRCDQCGKRFKTAYGLKSHVENHTPKSLRPFKCTLCSGSFVKEKSLRSHIKNIHTSRNEGPFACDKCNKDYASKFLLSHHVRNVHERARSYICDICAKAYKTKTILQNHMHQHSTTPRPKVQCNICGAWLKHEEILKKHVKLYHDIQTTVVNCPICNKEVPNKNALRNHTQYTHGERSHQCTLCDKAFKKALALKEHMALHTGQDLYQCTYCTKTFKSGANMHAHRKKLHFEEWTQDRLNRGVVPQKISST